MEAVVEAFIKFFFELFDKSKILMSLIIFAIWIVSSTSYMPSYMFEWTGLSYLVIQNQNNLRIAFFTTSIVLLVIIFPLYFYSKDNENTLNKQIKKIINSLTIKELHLLARFFVPVRVEIVRFNARNDIVLGLLDKNVLIITAGWQGFSENNMPMRINPIYIDGIFDRMNKLWG